jgi:transposase
VDLHKRHHTAVFVNGFKRKLGELKFENKPSAFPQLLSEVKKYLKKGMIPAFGLEDTGGYGRSLAVYLVENKQIVKEVNPALPNGVRKANPIVQKSDSWDAECVAQVLVDKFEDLPTSNPMDMYWMIGQLVTTRSAVAKEQATLLNQLHTQLAYHYPSYHKFFTELDGKTSLAFFEKYPAPHHLEGVEIAQLAEFLRKHSNYGLSTRKAEQILSLVKQDGGTKSEYQGKRDFIVQSYIRRIVHCKQEVLAVEKQLIGIMKDTAYKLETMHGIDLVTAAAFVAEIGDIRRFGTADKLARYSGIAPVVSGSGDRHRHYKCNQGNRVLHELFYRLACRQIGVIKGSKQPNNPYYYEYYQRKLSEKKTKKQAIVCIMRKLVDVIYALMKNKTEYVKPILIEKLAG